MNVLSLFFLFVFLRWSDKQFGKLFSNNSWLSKYEIVK